MSARTYLFNRKYSFSLLVLILTFVGFLTGCGSNQSEAPPKDTNGAKQAKEQAPAKETESVREITHAMGTTTIKGTPKRVVTLYQGANDAAVAFGVKPIGVVESWAQKPIYDYLKEGLDGAQIVGMETQPNLEEIAKLKPDLIIASKIRHEEIYNQLSQIAPTVVTETVFTFKETVDLMGQALNQEDKASELLTNWDNRVADFQGKVQEKLGDKWPFSASVLNFRADHARIYVTGFAGSILSELGFERPEQLKEIEKPVLKLQDKEGIPQMNADVFYVFLSDPGQDSAVQKTYDEWQNHPLWKNLDAVKANQVYTVDEVTWNLGGGILAANLMLDNIYDRFELEK